jgi:hypothetical protein
MKLTKITMVVVLCTMAIAMQWIALALIDVAEALQQMGDVAINKAKSLNKPERTK